MIEVWALSGNLITDYRFGLIGREILFALLKMREPDRG